MATSKKTIGEIDESYLLSTISGESKKEIVPQQTPSLPEPKTEPEPAEPKQKETPQKKRAEASGYMSTFLQKQEIKTRQCVYISQDVHAIVSAIVRVIADKDITVGGYIDKVLRQHIEDNKKEINELYKRNKNDLIQ